MDKETYQQVQALSRMTVGELRERYIDVFGEETRSQHKDFLRKRIAWRIQALAEGGLSERAKRRAEEIANDADLRIRTPRDPVKPGLMEVRQRSVTGRLSQLMDPRLPVPGTLLVREFKGRDIVVKVLDKGFEYDGRHTVPIYFLDADLPENSQWDRGLTQALYGGDEHYRISQEVILGIGGVRMLRALGYQ